MLSITWLMTLMCLIFSTERKLYSTRANDQCYKADILICKIDDLNKKILNMNDTFKNIQKERKIENLSVELNNINDSLLNIDSATVIVVVKEKLFEIKTNLNKFNETLNRISSAIATHQNVNLDASNNSWFSVVKLCMKL